MPIESAFFSASALVGIAQAIDAVVLIRRNGHARGWLLVFSAFEYVWAAICLVVMLLDAWGLCVTWLAQAFVIYIAASLALSVALNPRVMTQSPDAIFVPLPAVWLGGAFGVAYAAFAILCLANA